ncbi:hypothetical protein SLEP1_g24600 [Rubroshorea leprosula]|uniref:Transposase n=1 Tax=Rubroshorea leprosula TaxID=152421 RepID=A0AAV5JGF5_9ROSI|nr:hypothetical protein SLEP1_g24600 [Rubroshorea leprosula]
MPTDGTKIPLGLDDYGGLPQKVRRQIVVQLRENLPDAYTAWGQVLRELWDMYWNIFSQTYEWDPTIEKTIKDLWNMTARIKFKHALGELKAKCAKRNFQAKPPDMNPELWAKLVHLWTEEKLTVEYATRQKEEGFDPTIPHGEILLRAIGGVKKGWLKDLDIHTHPQDIGVSTSRREPFRPPIIGQSNRTIELEQTIESLKADNHSLRQTQMALLADNDSLQQ